MVCEEHLKAAVLVLLGPDTHLVAMQGIAQLVSLAPELQDPVPVDRAHFVFTAVLGQAQLLRERYLAGPIARDRCSSMQCLVRALMVVDRTPAIQRRLYPLQALKAPSLEHLDLQCSMEALVIAIGLRVVGSAVTDVNAQLYQPHAQYCELARRTCEPQGAPLSKLICAGRP